MSAFDSADGRALYRSVCAAPDDDLPRLVLADYLDESGGDADRDRAAFVRAQCEQTATPWMSPRWRELDLLAGRLLGVHRDAWGTPLKGKVLDARYARGFVSEVTVHSKRFAEKGEELFDAAPIRGVKFVTLRSARGAVPLARLLASPFAGRLRTLDLSTTPLSAGELGELAAAGSGPLAGLDALTLGLADPAGWAGELPGVVDGLPGLTRVDLSGAGGVGDADLAALARAPGFARLAALSVTTNGVMPDGRRPTVGGATAAGVRELFAGPPGALREFRAGVWLGALDLDEAFGGNDWEWPDLDPAVVAAVGSAPRPAGLRRLALHGLAPAGVDALVRATALDGLEELDFGQTEPWPADLDRLLAAPFARSLRVVAAQNAAADPRDPAAVAALRTRLPAPPTEA